jgi:hypothetical protein
MKARYIGGFVSLLQNDNLSCVRHFTRFCALVASFLVAMSLSAAQAADALAAKAPVSASDVDVLLDMFQQKGLVSAEEAEQARKKIAARHAEQPAVRTTDSRINFGDWIKRVDLYGDARLRFEYRGGATELGDHMERNRWRYRLRFGANPQFSDNLRMGLRLGTGPGGRSDNVTFGDDPGVFGKQSDGIFVGLLYLNWEPAEWVSLTAGRQPNPMRTTSLVWDSDLAPEAITEHFKHSIGNLGLFATFSQMQYDNANPNNAIAPGLGFSNAYLFANQIGARYQFNKEMSLQVAPAIYVYAGDGGDSFNTIFTGATAQDSVGVNDLLVLAVPAEFRFRAGKWPARLFADFAVNLEGADRARAAGQPAHDNEIFAYQVGLELGSERRKGDWLVRAFWEHAQLFALDMNLVDSDFFDSRLNMEGVGLRGSYSFTDFLLFSLSYGYANPINRALPTGGIGDLAPVNPLRRYHLIQADLSWRF